VRAGWVLIVMGISMGVLLGHADAIVAGIGLVLLGAWVLSVKGAV
jgi:hypothetical protein